MIRLVATLATAALVIWTANRSIELGHLPEPVARAGERAARVLAAVADAGESALSRLDSEDPAKAAALEVSVPRSLTREEFEPDLGAGEGAMGAGNAPDEVPAARRAVAGARATSLSRASAEAIRCRLDRVMSLALGPSR